MAEIAEVEGIDISRVYRLLRLTLLAPEIVEQLVGRSFERIVAILKGEQR